ncbi:MAG: glycosyltransferase [Deltaproteobacteria bacterium]|nr:glycosyltransferase [Deltaproteobacteria bacterium]
MGTLIESYEAIVGEAVIEHLFQLAGPLQGSKILHVNSTKEGGGVAEILNRLVPLMRELGLEADWQVITGESDFYRCTKTMHNALQGKRSDLSRSMIEAYESANRENYELLKDRQVESDFVFIHDPQPALFLNLCPERRGKWIWRCHIDVSHPYLPVWKYLRRFVRDYDASIWSMAAFAQKLPHPLYLVPPSIDPLSEKNIPLEEQELKTTMEHFGLDPRVPIVAQVSRFDRFKDPVGVIQAFRMVRKYTPLQLVLAGGGATDDPEGKEVLDEVMVAAGDDPQIKVLLLPPDAHRTINALQRVSDIVIQKSVKEGFGLTVTEALWKGKPVIGGATGGIRLQVVNHHTGFLVNSPEGAALRIRYLLKRKDAAREMGEKGRAFVLHNFLITRHLREYLTLMVAMSNNAKGRIEL